MKGILLVLVALGTAALAQEPPIFNPGQVPHGSNCAPMADRTALCMSWIRAPHADEPFPPTEGYCMYEETPWWQPPGPSWRLCTSAVDRGVGCNSAWNTGPPDARHPGMRLWSCDSGSIDGTISGTTTGSTIFYPAPTSTTSTSSTTSTQPLGEGAR